MTGAPGRTIWVSATQNSASAFCWAIAAASVTGVIAPARGNGVATMAWPAAAIAIRPSLIGPSRRSGEFVLMIVIRDGSLRKGGGLVDAPGRGAVGADGNSGWQFSLLKALSAWRRIHETASDTRQWVIRRRRQG